MSFYLGAAFAFSLFFAIESVAANCSLEQVKTQLDLICDKIATVTMAKIPSPEVNKVTIFDMCGISQALLYLPNPPDYPIVSLPLRPWLNGKPSSMNFDNDGKNPYVVIAEQLADKKVKYGKISSSSFYSELPINKKILARKCVNKTQDSVIAAIGLYVFPNETLSSSHSLPVLYSLLSSKEYFDSLAITEQASPEESQKILSNLIDKIVDSIDYAKVNRLLKTDEKILKTIFTTRAQRYLGGFRPPEVAKNAPLFLMNVLEQLDLELESSDRLRKLMARRTEAQAVPAEAKVSAEKEKAAVDTLAQMFGVQEKQITDLLKLKNIFGFKLQNVILGFGVISVLNLIGLIVLLTKL